MYHRRSLTTIINFQELASDDEDVDMTASREEDILDREMAALTPWPIFISTKTIPLDWDLPSSPPAKIPSKKRKHRSNKPANMSSDEAENDIQNGRQSTDLKRDLSKRIKLSDYLDADDAGMVGSGTKHDPIHIEIDPSSIWYPDEQTVCQLLFSHRLLLICGIFRYIAISIA